MCIVLCHPERSEGSHHHSDKNEMLHFVQHDRFLNISLYMNNRILYTPKEKKQFQKQKKHYYMRVGVGVFVLMLIVAGTFFGVRLQALQIHNVSLNGLSAIQEEDVKREIASMLSGSYAAGLVPYRFLLAAPTEAIIQHIKNQFPLIAGMEIKKEFPDTLAITIQERQLFGVLCNDGVGIAIAGNDRADEGSVDQEDREIQCFYLDTAGIAYQKAPQTQGFLIMKVSTDAPDIPLGGHGVDPMMMRRMMELNQKLPAAVGSAIVGYRLLHTIPHELRAVTKQGFSLMIKQDGDMDSLLYVLKTVLDKEIGNKRGSLDYVDLRFGNKVFYKFR